MYITSPPQGSVLSSALRILRQAMKGRWSLNPLQTVKNMRAPDFWESAKPSNFKGETRPKWMTFDDRWVDEVSRGFKACSVFAWYPIYCMPVPSSCMRTVLTYPLQGSRTTSSTTT